MNGNRMSTQRAYGARPVSRRRALGQLGAGALIAGALAAIRSTAVWSQATPNAGSAESVARQAIEAVNTALATGETTALDTAFAADVAGHPPHRSLATGEPFSHDLAGLKAGLADIHRFIPDATIAIDEVIASEDTVAARVTFRGTLEAAALGLGDEAAAPLEIGGLMHGRVEDGRIAEFWAYFDLSAYADLVGLLSRTAQATPEESSGHGHDGAADEPPGDGHDETAAAGEVEAGAEEVAVTVTEFSVTLAPSRLRAGQPYAFVVTNKGAVAHEFVIERPGAIHEPLVVGEREAMEVGIAPGETRTLGWTFAEPGSYQLACHEPGHYEAGQAVVIEVAG